MSEDYVWNRTGKPDPQTEYLENLLIGLAYREKTKNHRSYWMGVTAIAATLVLGVFLWLERGEKTEWYLSLHPDESRVMRTGEVIETDAFTTASVRDDATGSLTVEPQSRLRLVESKPGRQQFSLEYGAIRAFIWASPAKFAVNIPAARAVDLGCQYTLHVGKDGAGFLTVDLGWVAFESEGIESFIPAGAECRTDKKKGPGIPFFSDTSDSFKKYLLRFEQHHQNLTDVLKAAQRRDALTLWHLLSRTHGEEREQVYQRLAEVVALSPAASPDAIYRGDPAAFDAAWLDLGLGETTWWRTWKREW